jgi:hypothetical protein
MIKNIARIAITFLTILLSNNLANSTPVGFDGGNPTPTCGPTTCYPPIQLGN